MSMDGWDDVPMEEAGEDVMDTSEEEIAAKPVGKFDRLTNENSRKFKFSGMFRDWFLDYSSYVILQRAVPHIVDGLKPVQRRVLHAMYAKDDGSFTKVANIVGQAMAFHPHGDQSILGALVQLGQKGYTVECQGNWGNILTGDENAAARYIECRLSKFAKEVVFDPKVTPWMTSYDGRAQEPTELPVRFPLLLAQGTEGIAVGMSSKILPHNFNELIDASIAILKGEPYEIYPDFPTGGFVDCSRYMHGKRGGSVKVRARIEKRDKNMVAITEVPYGKTTHMLIESIIKAKDKGKIKLSKIEDMTANRVEIVIHLQKDVSPDKTIDALYAFTDCETTIAPNACVIKENKPEFMSVNEILEYDTWHTKDILQRQLEIRLGELEDKWHYDSLERIFFEEGVYKILEGSQKSWEKQLAEIFARMKEYQSRLRREIVMEDVNRLVEKPVRKISRFDTKAIDDEIKSLEKQMHDVKDKLAHIIRYTMDWFGNLKKKYGNDHPRLTEITNFETIAATRVVNNNARLYVNYKEGFVGTGLKKEEGTEYVSDCSDLSEIIIIGKSGRYRVTKVSDKTFFGNDILYAGVFSRNDERTIYNVIYRDGKGGTTFAKRFAITSVTRDKDYDITQGKPGSSILWLTANHNGEAEIVKIYLRPKPKLKKTVMEYDFSSLAVKGRTSRGNVVTKNTIHRIALKVKGVSTIGGKDIWYDSDVQRLNEDGRGLHLGQFASDDKILAIFKDGTYYTTSFDLSNRYQGEVLRMEKLDTGRTYTALYWDNKAKAFYVKRFSFTISDNTPVSFISDAKGSRLVNISADAHSRFKVIFGGRSAAREPEIILAEEYIGKKGLGAKGKKCHSLEVEAVLFAEPLPEDEAAGKEADLEDGDDTGESTGIESEALENTDIGSLNVLNEETFGDESKPEEPKQEEAGTKDEPESWKKGYWPGETVDLDYDEPTLFDNI